MFGELIVAYLFLGGTGAGACAVAAVLGLLADGADVCQGLAARFRDGGNGRPGAYRRLFVSLWATALIALVLGVVCLSADVGRIDRVLVLAVSAPTNYLVVGFWALAACAALGIATLLVWQGAMPGSYRLLMALNGASLVAACVAAVYTGLLLAGLASVPLWFGPWLPAVFLLSALSCGTALTAAVMVLAGADAPFGRVLQALGAVDMGLIGLEAIALAGWLGCTWLGAGGTLAQAAPATPTDAAALASVAALVEGSWAPMFWGVLGAVGLAVPFGLEGALLEQGRRRGSPRRTASAVVLVSAACVLVGGAALRWLVVMAAVQPMVSSAAYVL